MPDVLLDVFFHITAIEQQADVVGFDSFLLNPEQHLVADSLHQSFRADVFSEEGTGPSTWLNRTFHQSRPFRVHFSTSPRSMSSRWSGSAPGGFNRYRTLRANSAIGFVDRKLSFMTVERPRTSMPISDHVGVFRRYTFWALS